MHPNLVHRKLFIVCFAVLLIIWLDKCDVMGWLNTFSFYFKILYKRIFFGNIAIAVNLMTLDTIKCVLILCLLPLEYVLSARENSYIG